MNWVNPGLSYLFFLIGLIYIIYLLKRKKIKYSFSSLLLWEDFEIHETSRSQFKRFLPDLLFWIHLLILILLILSLLRPQMIFNERDRERKIIIIDRSASMQAEDVEPDRFEVSRQKIIDYINELESGREIALVSAAAEPEVIHEFTSSRQELIEVVEELQVTDTAINPEECIESALSLADDSGELVFFTDSSFPDINYQKQNPLEIKQIGTEADNLGITDIDIKPAGKDEVYQVMIQVGNFTSESRQVPVKIEDQNNDIISEKTLDIESEEIESTIFKLDLNSEMILKLFLDIEDDALTLDNKAWLTTGDKDPLQVLLVGPDPDFFLENALNTNDKIDLVTRENIVGKESEEFDLVIYDDIFAPVMTGGNTFFINRFPANYREYIQEGRVSEKIGEWDRGNTLFKHIDINN
ncbi:MAG: vWA domain-containing protein [Bacillota bacterium]